MVFLGKIWRASIASQPLGAGALLVERAASVRVRVGLRRIRDLPVLDVGNDVHQLIAEPHFEAGSLREVKFSSNKLNPEPNCTRETRFVTIAE